VFWDTISCRKDSSTHTLAEVHTRVGGADKDGNPNVMNKLQPASILSVDFKVMGVTVSGLSVDSLAISNESYRPYKGVRSITKAGLFEVRT
jgi:hypothetical protein